MPKRKLSSKATTTSLVSASRRISKQKAALIRRLDEFANQDDAASVAMIDEVLKCKPKHETGRALSVLFERNQRDTVLLNPAASLIHPLV